jgi:hypothetical protein
VAPGPIPEKLAAPCRIEVNRQADDSMPPDRGPRADVWGTDMATSIGELADLGHAS